MTRSTPFIASNGVKIQGGDSLLIHDAGASASEARMMTIQARKTEALREFFQRPTAPRVVHILKPITGSAARIRVPFIIDFPETGEKIAGDTDVIQTGDRVYIETVAGGRVILCNKVDPSEAENDYDAIRAEVMRIEAFSLPLASRSTDAAAALVHAYVSAGRPEWG